MIGINKEGKVVEGVGKNENSAYCIHTGVRNRFKHKCVMHLHTPYATALGEYFYMITKEPFMTFSVSGTELLGLSHCPSESKLAIDRISSSFVKCHDTFD